MIPGITDCPLSCQQVKAVLGLLVFGGIWFGISILCFWRAWRNRKA